MGYGCFVLLAVYHLLRPKFRPLAVRGAAAALLFGALFFTSQVFFRADSWRDQTLIFSITGLISDATFVFICFLLARSIASKNRALRSLLLSSAIVLPLFWTFTFSVGLLWPVPAVERMASSPPQFLLIKLRNIPEALYMALAAGVFLKEALKTAPDLARRRLQNLFFFLGSLGFVIITTNAYLTAAFRVIGGARKDATVPVLLSVESIVSAGTGLFFLLGIALYCSRSRRDRALDLVAKWIRYRQPIEAHLWKHYQDNLGSNFTTAFFEQAARNLGLSPRSKARAEYMVKLVSMANLDPENRRLIYPLSRIQEVLLKDPEISTRLSVHPHGQTQRETRGYDMQQDLLYQVLRPTIDISSPNSKPDLLNSPECVQLAAVVAADAGSLSPPMRDHVLKGSAVSRHVLSAYFTAKHSVMSNER